MTFEKDVMAELKDIKEGVNGNSISLTRVEGKMEVHDVKIGRNEDDIAKHDLERKDSDHRLHKRIEKVDGKLNNALLKLTGAAATAGAAAGAAWNALANRINGG